MIVKTAGYQSAEYKYASMFEMMTHIASMASDGWILYSFTRIEYHATFRRDMPL